MAFYPLEKLHRLGDGYQKAFRAAGRSLVLLQLEGQVWIIENRCPHMDVPLENANPLPGGKIRCRAHGIEFDLATGKAAGPLANQLDCLVKFPPAYQGNEIGVEL